MRRLSFARFVIAFAITAVTPVPAAEDVIVPGKARFPHDLHALEMEIECESCHHETNAAKLSIPHPEYFSDVGSRCKTCHDPGTQRASAQACSNCHHASPSSAADESLSAKVVVHRSCWSCHEVETGQSASQSCATCHATPANRADAVGATPRNEEP